MADKHGSNNTNGCRVKQQGTSIVDGVSMSCSVLLAMHHAAHSVTTSDFQ